MKEVDVLLLNVHEDEGKWLDWCKTKPIKTRNKNVVGKIIDLKPQKDGLLCTISIKDNIFDKFVECGTLQFYRGCKHPHFRIFFDNE